MATSPRAKAARFQDGLAGVTDEASTRERFGDIATLKRFAQDVGRALSSNSGEWNRESPTALASQPAGPVGKESFSTMFARMHAESSNSDEWKRPTSEGAPAYAMANA